eukprot:178771-Chlamydomonas_euryale.AAC.1
MGCGCTGMPGRLGVGQYWERWGAAAQASQGNCDHHVLLGVVVVGALQHAKGGFTRVTGTTPRPLHVWQPTACVAAHAMRPRHAAHAMQPRHAAHAMQPRHAVHAMQPRHAALSCGHVMQLTPCSQTYLSLPTLYPHACGWACLSASTHAAGPA